MRGAPGYHLSLDQVAVRVVDRAGHAVAVRVDRVERIEPEANGKRRAVISRVKA